MPEILIYDEIGGTSSKEFRQSLDSIEASDEPLTIRINSVGGVVTQGMAMASAIRAYPGKTTVIVEGICASIATVIALAADEIVMADGSFWMIHNPSIQAQGDSREMLKTAADLQKMQTEMLTVYERATGKTADELQALMDAETYFTADEAVSTGFASRIEGNADFSMAAVARLTNPPTALLAKRKAGNAMAMTDEETAKMKALEEECAALKAKCDEMESKASEDSEEEPGDAEASEDEEEAKAEEGDEEEEAKASLLKAALAVAKTKSYAAAEGALMALHAKAGTVAETARASEVEGLLKAGKLAPAQKPWAMKASASALKSYVASLGDSTVIPTHDFKPAADPKAPSGEAKAATNIRSLMRGK